MDVKTVVRLMTEAGCNIAQIRHVTGLSVAMVQAIRAEGATGGPILNPAEHYVL